MSPERPPKVFISYSHDSDEHMERVLSLAGRLRASGVDAMIDQYMHDPEHGWQTWTETQMRDSDLVLVVCTETYLKRAERREEPGTGHGAIWEISVGYVLLYNQGMKNKKLIPVVFDKSDRAFIPLPLQPYTNYCVADDQGYLELYRRLTNQPLITMPELGRIESLPSRQRATEKFTRSKPARLWNVPHSRNDAFTGREQLLSDLRNDLVEKHKQALSGLGGVGKTQIAVEYAYGHKDDYTAVLWTFADTEQSIRGGFAQIAPLLNLPEKDATEQAKVTEAVRRWLDENPGWLLVFDNADDPDIVKNFLPQRGQGHILLTSRAHTFDILGIFSPREVDVLSPDEARQFLLLRTGGDSSSKSPEADALAKELGYLPLALEQSAAYIMATDASFSMYLSGFHKQRQVLLNKQRPILGSDTKERQKRTVATAWAMNFSDIEKNFPASAELLRVTAFLGSDAIPFELFEKGRKELPEKMSAAVSEAADYILLMGELLSPLLRYSLIHRDNEKLAYSIHPLVQEVIRDGLNSAEQRNWAQRIVLIFVSAMPDSTNFENWPTWNRFLPHALVCVTFAESLNLASEPTYSLLNHTAHYLQYRIEYLQSEPIVRKMLRIAEKIFGPESSEAAAGQNNLADLYIKLGQYEKAEPLLQQALSIWAKSEGREHPLTAYGFNNLGLIHFIKGEMAEAEPLFRRALKICKKLSRQDDEQIAQILNNLGLLSRVQGQLNRAESFHRRALAIREKVLGTDHPNTALSLGNLAEVYRYQGELEKAESLHLQALAIREKIQGPEHPETALCLNNLGELYRDQRHLAKAELFHLRALAIREKMLGPSHPDTAASLNNLGLLYYFQLRRREAEAFMRRALMIQEEAVGPAHPDTILYRTNLIWIYRDQGKNVKAEALERVAGEPRKEGR